MNASSLKTKNAFVLGYTGEVGKKLVQHLLEKEIFQKVVLIGRRKVEYPDGSRLANTEQKIISFDDLDKHKDAFEGCEYGFCCLGTTRSKSGADGFYKIDHDYVVNSAKIAHETGCKHFSVVSATGSDRNSMFLYNRTKGEMEAHVADIGFDTVSIFKPGFLLCEREESRIVENVGKVMLKPLNWLFPTSLSVATDSVAKAMIYDALTKADASAEKSDRLKLINNHSIHELAASYSQLLV